MSRTRPIKSWIGQDAILHQLLACWLVVDPRDLPLSPRLTGPPGIGKTTLAMAAARLRKQPLYINQCTADTRPEDLIITPVLAESGKIAYHASPLVSAMLTGGVCVLDEGNRMNEKSWASLAPLLDHRRYVESIVAGITIPAHPDFRVCVTMNEDESTYEVPDYILSRLQPTSALGFPDPRRRDGDPQVPPAVRRGRAPGPDGRVPPAGASAQARFLAARRDQPAAVRDQADGAGPRPPDRPRRRLARGPVSACWAKRRPTSKTWPAASAAPWAASTRRSAWATSSSAPMIRSIPTRTTTHSKTRIEPQRAGCWRGALCLLP